MVSEKANVRQRKKSEKSTDPEQELTKKDVPTDVEDESKQPRQ